MHEREESLGEEYADQIKKNISEYVKNDAQLSKISLNALMSVGNKKKRIVPHNHNVAPGKFLYEVDPLNPKDLTRAIREGRKHAMDCTRILTACVPDQKDVFVLRSADNVGVRDSRRVHGIETVLAEDVINFNKYDDGIAKGSWDIDIYNPHEYEGHSVPRHTEEYQQRINKMKKGDYYSIRYGAVVAKGVDNLLMAGRCISSERVAQASLRIQQTCISTGEAAGAAASISIKEGLTLAELNPKLVVDYLSKKRSYLEAKYSLHILPEEK